MSTQAFVCFRGRDVRYGFLTHLYAALDQTGLFTYKDIEDSRKGGEIFPALMKAIEESHIAIIIFSENFASSSWCLIELSRIMELKAKKGLLVVPVFYKVEPSEVRYQRNRYGESIRRHVERERNYPGTLAKWRTALRDASSISGWSLNDGCEARLIKSIVEYISEWNMYDVFLSFRGKDVRENFVKRLNEALCHHGCKTFIDDNLTRGQDFPPALKNAIKRSRICVVVFSENYAESWWCLKELVQILKGKNQGKQRMLPIFYQVEPREVREQKKQSYVEALANHVETFGKRSVEKWGKALSEAANTEEFHVCDGNEDDWIRRIVKEIMNIRESWYEEIRQAGMKARNVSLVRQNSNFNRQNSNVSEMERCCEIM